MAVAAILNLLPVAIFTYSRLSTVDLSHRTHFYPLGNTSLGALSVKP